MLPRFHWSDISTVGHYLGLLVIVTGILMLIPAATALLFGEAANFVAFVFGSGCCLFVGGLLRLLKAHRLDRRRSLLITGLSWVVVALMAAIPILATTECNSLMDALFGAVSSLTTTGTTLSEDVDHMSYSLTTWRAILTLMGGQAVLVIAMYLGFAGEGGQLVLANRQGTKGDRSSLMRDTWRFIVMVAVFFVVFGTVVAFCFGLFLGLTPVDSLMNGFWLAANSVSTGGFTPHASNVIYYHSIGLEAFLAVLMLVGSINFGIFSCAIRGRWDQVRRNSELRTFAGWIVLLTVFVTFALTRDQVCDSLASFFNHGIFLVISAATTGGLQSVYPQQFGTTVTDVMIIALSVAAIFGTCSHSTGGGIKTIRIMLVLRWIAYSILQHLLPNSARVRIKYEHFGQHPIGPKDATRAMTIFILYIVASALGAMAFIAHGNDALDSVFEAVSYVSNSGLTAGLTNTHMSFDLKLVAMLLMWAGRLEFIALLAVFTGILMSISPTNLLSQKRDRVLSRTKKKSRGGMAWHRRKSQEHMDRDAGRRGGFVRVGALIVTLLVVVSLVVVPFALAAEGDSMGTTSGAPGTGGVVNAEDVADLAEHSEYQRFSINGLLSATKRLDGDGVVFSGEAIGSPINADAGHKWINLKQGSAMIGVYVTDDMVSKIEKWGHYGTVGDKVRIYGVYHLSCPDHAGELEVHADSLEIAAIGSFVNTGNGNMDRLVVGLLLAVVGVGLIVGRRIVRGKLRLPLWLASNVTMKRTRKGRPRR